MGAWVSPFILKRLGGDWKTWVLIGIPTSIGLWILQVGLVLSLILVVLSFDGTPIKEINNPPPSPTPRPHFIIA